VEKTELPAVKEKTMDASGVEEDNDDTDLSIGDSDSEYEDVGDDEELNFDGEALEKKHTRGRGTCRYLSGVSAMDEPDKEFVPVEGAHDEEEEHEHGSDRDEHEDEEGEEHGEGEVEEEEDGHEGEEKGEKKEKYDDDEDKKKPQYIPKSGPFYQHDDRNDEGDLEEPKKEDPVSVAMRNSLVKFFSRLS
jgi:protein CASC3